MVAEIRVFGSVGCMRVCVNRNRGPYWFLFCKGPILMIFEAILIPKVYARLQKIASNFSKFLGGGPRRRSVRGFAPLLSPPFQDSWICP